LLAIIHHKDYSSDEEIFFDRSPFVFKHILNYLRFQSLDYKKLDPVQMEYLLRDAEFYELTQMTEYLSEKTKDIRIIKFEYSGPFKFNNSQIIGTNLLEDVVDNKNLKKGAICTDGPGWIIFELNCDWDINSVEVGPYVKDPNKWKSQNGVGAKIYASMEKKIWTEIGVIPSTYGSKPIVIPLKTISAKYIKFQHTGQIGIAYIKFNPS